MKGQGGASRTAIVLILAFASLSIVSMTTPVQFSSVESRAVGGSPEQIRTNGLPASVVQCDAGTYDNCRDNSFTYEEATAYARLRHDDLPNTVLKSEGLRYECNSGAWLRFASDDPSYSADSSGVEVLNAEKIPSSGKIDFSRIEGTDAFQIICADHDYDGGFWSWASVWVEWNNYDVVQDSDGDGVIDSEDEFPNDPDCSSDSDGDGVCDAEDNFPNDPDCVEDGDGDGVCNQQDFCPGTSPDIRVNDRGCPIDSDGDGVPDHQDECPNTGASELGLHSNGCPKQDADNDGVIDRSDVCPEEPGTGPFFSDSPGCPNFIEKLVQLVASDFTF